MKILLAPLLAALMLSGCVNTKKSDNKTMVALQTAPEFTLKNVLGGDLKSADLKGKVVVVDFWATWCVPCKVEIPDYNQMRERFSRQDVEWLGVTFDSGSAKDVVPYLKELNIQYPVVMGTDAVDAAFGGHPGYPTTFLVGKDWKVYRVIRGSTANKMKMLERDIALLVNKPDNVTVVQVPDIPETAKKD